MAMQITKSLETTNFIRVIYLSVELLTLPFQGSEGRRSEIGELFLT